MSLKSEAVKRWRKNTKRRLLEAMGGKCIICNYSRCDAALDFHHKDPEEKDFSLGAARASIKNWKQLVEEVKKCVILCAICHREYHEGLVKIPDIQIEFDKRFEDYKEFDKQESLTPCLICGKLKNKENVTCSASCAARRRSKIDWSTVELKELIKDNPITKIAEQLGVSDVAVHKRLKKLGLK